MKSRGMSLLEVLLAMAILGSGLVLLVQSWGGQYTRIKKIDRSFEAATLLQRKMAEVEIKYRGKSIEEIPDGPEEEEIEGHPEYSYKLVSKKLVPPNFGAMMKAVQGEIDGNLLQLVNGISEYFGKTVKEVVVTLIYKPEGAKKPLEYSLTTYFIDFDKEMAFGANGVTTSTPSSDSGAGGSVSPSGGVAQ